jgi:hypothetical protein
MKLRASPVEVFGREKQGTKGNGILEPEDTHMCIYIQAGALLPRYRTYLKRLVQVLSSTQIKNQPHCQARTGYFQEGGWKLARGSFV